MSDNRSTDLNRPLTEQQKACVEYYLSHKPYNYSAAYNAIYPPKDQSRGSQTCRTAAYNFFSNPRVKAYKEQRLKEIYEAANINAESIALRLSDIAFDTRDEMTASSLKALDLLQKQLGLQNKKVDIDANVAAGITIIDDYGE